MEISPSILTADINDFWRQIKRLVQFFNHFQIDITDGEFVKNKTVGVDDILQTITDNRQLITENYLVFDFHLMVVDFGKRLEEIKKVQKFVSVDTVFVHLSLSPNFHLLQDKYPFKLGLVLNPEDSVKLLTQKYDLNLLPAVQIMSVHPGAQGQPFIKDSLTKIEQLRNAGYRNKIYLDGGVNEKTLPLIFSQKYKPDVICPGSFFSKAIFIRKKVQFLQKFLRQD